MYIYARKAEVLSKTPGFEKGLRPLAKKTLYKLNRGPCGLVVHGSTLAFLYEVCFNVVLFTALLYASVAFGRCRYEKPGVSTMH
jgi:hypothetical protein